MGKGEPLLKFFFLTAINRTIMADDLPLWIRIYIPTSICVGVIYIGSMGYQLCLDVCNIWQRSSFYGRGTVVRPVPERAATSV